LKGLMIYFSFPHFGWEQYDIGSASRTEMLPQKR